MKHSSIPAKNYDPTILFPPSNALKFKPMTQRYLLLPLLILLPSHDTSKCPKSFPVCLYHKRCLPSVWAELFSPLCLYLGMWQHFLESGGKEFSLLSFIATICLSVKYFKRNAVFVLILTYFSQTLHPSFPYLKWKQHIWIRRKDRFTIMMEMVSMRSSFWAIRWMTLNMLLHRVA